MNYIYLFLVAVIPPLLIGLFLYFKDKNQKEPIRLILRSFFLGWLIVLPILGLHFLMDWRGIYDWVGRTIGTQTIGYSFFEAFIMAALIEEGLKYLAFKKGIWHSRFFDEYFDGVLYGALISLGFATLENIFYVFDYGSGTGYVRALTAIPAHAFFGIIMGYYFAVAKFSFTNTRRNLWLAFLIPFLLHGFYDIIIFEISRITEENDPWFYPFVISFWILMIGMLVLSRWRIRTLLKKDAEIYPSSEN